jgi:SAM-dependent methyltransferase
MSNRDAHLQKLIDFYQQRENEEARLETDIGRLEAERLQDLMGRFLPPSPSSVLDVGGATGRYASWLAGRGYAVSLVDPVPLHVSQAKSRAAVGPSFGTAVGDARSLDAADNSFDAVLLFGPLYHLPAEDDRRLALAEARRVLRPGGVLLAIVISRHAGVLHTLRGDYTDTGFMAVGYLHDPLTAGDEVRRAGFDVAAVIGVEGPGWLLDGLRERWTDPTSRDRLLRVARTIEAERSLLGVSPHVLIAAKRPADN